MVNKSENKMPDMIWLYTGGLPLPFHSILPIRVVLEVFEPNRIGSPPSMRKTEYQQTAYRQLYKKM